MPRPVYYQPYLGLPAGPGPKIPAPIYEPVMVKAQIAQIQTTLGIITPQPVQPVDVSGWVPIAQKCALLNYLRTLPALFGRVLRLVRSDGQSEPLVQIGMSGSLSYGTGLYPQTPHPCTVQGY